MPTTVNRALPYPTAGDADNVPYDLQQLAEAIDATLGPEDTGWVTITTFSAGMTAGTPAPQVRVKNKTLYCRGAVNGTTPAGATTPVCTFPAGFRPPVNRTLPLLATNSSATVGRTLLTSAGLLSQNIASGISGSINVTYLDALVIPLD